ncbi:MULTISPECIES: hypothetical protein [Corallococcus]|uniref:Uncharacterized protein n=1 Tax=Corallococcus exiguus TaxID=83462 RepID=A0A7X4YEI5_9BACT|nr:MULTISPECIES: hypothetical protein [Corallococcus]NBC43998.1 hypothetical protein [Corallococcus exiguus]NRD56415.1 hypothetical protein [Corallococcus exiguus]RKH26296.1 hypothetical protein D7V77_15140 [Corallococcus sp. CA041A]TNV64399.1 hypothetical protein FH620_12505 [Corallococcus exiguus]
MSVRLPSGLPRPGLPLQSPAQEKEEKAQSGEGKSSGKATGKGGTGKGGVAVKGGSAKGASAKGGLEQSGPQDGMDFGRSGEPERNEGGGARAPQQQAGMASGTSQGAASLGTLEQPPALAAQTAQTAPALPQPPPMAQQVPVAPQLERRPAASESSRERTASDGQSSDAAKQAMEGRAKLRIAVLHRLHRGLTEVEGKMSAFLANPGRQGVVTLPVVLSVSTVTFEWWKSANAVPEDRAYLAQVLGEPGTADDATLLATLRAEIGQAFAEFPRTPQGVEARKLYDAVLQKYEAARIQPIIAGHDSGPVVEECARLGLSCEMDFTRSLLLSPWMLATSQSPEEGNATQVMVAGLTLPQLGALVGHLRQLNPLLSNPQLRALLLRASTDKRLALRKVMGLQEVEQVQELARQLLRLQAVQHLTV